MCRLIGFVVVALLVPGPSWAQTAHPTFETVGSVLKAGETVVVTCENCEKGKIRGRLSMASASAIELTVGDQMHRIPGDRILRIERPRDSIWNGVGIGIASGAGIGAAIGALGTSSDDFFSPGVVALGLAIIGTGIGAAVGAVVDSARGGSTIVFERAALRPGTEIGLFTSKGAAGLQLQLRF